MKKLTIDDLPVEARQKLMAQINAENPKPKRSKKLVNPNHWQGKEKEFQYQVESYLELIGFAKRNKKSILSTQGQGGKLGWQIHISRAIGNPYVLDVILFDHYGRFLEFELKTATGKLSDLQELIVSGRGHLVCRCMDDVIEVVQAWLRD